MLPLSKHYLKKENTILYRHTQKMLQVMEIMKVIDESHSLFKDITEVTTYIKSLKQLKLTKQEEVESEYKIYDMCTIILYNWENL